MQKHQTQTRGPVAVADRSGVLHFADSPREAAAACAAAERHYGTNGGKRH